MFYQPREDYAMRQLAIPLLLVLTLSAGSLPAAAETVPFFTFYFC